MADETYHPDLHHPAPSGGGGSLVSSWRGVGDPSASLGQTGDIYEEYDTAYANHVSSWRKQAGGWFELP